ncbi:MAG: hypothetical protein IKQ46_00940 [Bacteroidales bacterium]|nr:hypothetical protein [Bacteroidales bacterium]
MANLQTKIRNKWCGILMVLLAVMGFSACHNTQKAVVDNNNPSEQKIDSVHVVKPPENRGGGEIIALYGVPPSKFKKIDK